MASESLNLWQGIFIIIGVFVGFLLNEISYYIREYRKQNSKKKAVKFLIYIEIEHNLNLLKTFKKEIKSSEEEFNFLKILNTSLPSFKSIFLEKNASSLSIVFNKNELLKIYEVYTNLDKLKNIYNLMNSDEYESPKPIEDRLQGLYANLERMTYSYYAERQNKRYYIFESELKNILANGNPINA